jgi:hypothetical protein
MVKRRAVINFKYIRNSYWDVTITDRKTGNVIYNSISKLGSPTLSTVEDRINKVREDIGDLIHSKGYYF